MQIRTLRELASALITRPWRHTAVHAPAPTYSGDPVTIDRFAHQLNASCPNTAGHRDSTRRPFRRSQAGKRPSMAEHVFTPEQIEQGIEQALHDRELEIVPSLLRLLAVQDPHRAACLLEVVKDALKGRVAITVDLGASHG